jgi:formyltetrahydrofolate-dependent phosphoribosylglycinamide formyltransferase
LSPLQIVVLLSGGGTTLANLIAKIADGSLDARIERVVSSTSKARGLQIAAEAGIPTSAVDPKTFSSIDDYSAATFAECRRAEPHLVVMGGFLKFVKIPSDFEGRVVNIHPALIPAFCGHGFYGRRVHEAVLNYGAKVSGCTVHFVDQQYDHGPIILQRVVPVEEDDTPDTLAARVFAAECEAFPEALRWYASARLRIEGRHVRIAPQA